MYELLETRTDASSPFASRLVQSRFVSVEEAERDAVNVYYGSLTKRALVNALVVLLFLFIMGSSAVNARAIAMATQFKVGGAVLLSICTAGLAYVIYEYRRKQRVIILEDAFAVERRFAFEVELVRWTDVAKLYCLDRTTVTKYSIYFVPVSTSTVHHGKLRIVLVDGREIVITNRVRNFSALATQFILRTKAAQLAPCTTFLIDGGKLDFDKLGLTSEGLVYKGKPLSWNDIQRISLDSRGTLIFRTAKLWRSPRFNTSTLPNASLLLELLAMFGGDVLRGVEPIPSSVGNLASS
jgi:hypothetical protein